jgi:dipeptidase E
MRLYLSSFRLGKHPERLVAMVPPPGRVAVVCNAIDNEAPDVRAEKVAAELARLRDLGLDPSEVDLRGYDDPVAVRGMLSSYDAVWVRGGNVFVLRAALRRSGADRVIAELLREDAIVYAGYSAGACVLAPSLRGLELCDDASAVAEVTWEGLGILDHAFVPHLNSPGHPETELLEKLSASYDADGTPYVGLRDGQAIVVDGAFREVV